MTNLFSLLYDVDRLAWLDLLAETTPAIVTHTTLVESRKIRWLKTMTNLFDDGSNNNNNNFLRPISHDGLSSRMYLEFK